MLSIYSKTLSLINNLWMYVTDTSHNNSDPMILINNLISKCHARDRQLLCNVKEVRNKSAHMGIITSYNIRMLKYLQDQTSIDINPLIESCQIMVNWIESHKILPIGTHICIEKRKEVGYIDEYILNANNEVCFVVVTVNSSSLICDSNTNFTVL